MSIIDNPSNRRAYSNLSNYDTHEPTNEDSKEMKRTQRMVKENMLKRFIK